MKGQRDVNARGRRRREATSYWTFGINAVERRLVAQPASVREVCVLRGDHPRRAILERAARGHGIAVRIVEGDTLRRLTGSDAHQGVAALVGPFPYADLDVVLETDPGPVLMLDHLQDPHNFGALVRTAAAAGVAAVVIPRDRAAGVTGAVEKVAAGAVNDVPICQVANLHRALVDLREVGYWSIALTPIGGTSIFDLELPDRPVLVLGGETGLHPLVETSCDLRASIPQRAGVESLNASVAGAVAMYDVSRRLDRLQRLDSI
ncbi:RNA methyltransferase [bacterium]|nr:RNA methyltransferase [bacterium]